MSEKETIEINLTDKVLDKVRQIIEVYDFGEPNDTFRDDILAHLILISMLAYEDKPQLAKAWLEGFVEKVKAHYNVFSLVPQMKETKQ